jgi:uncharacterized delta-60 repeat protein
MEALERRRVLSAGHIDPTFPADSALAHEVVDADAPEDRQVWIDLYPLANGQTLTLRTHLVPPVLAADDFQAFVKRFNADGSLDRSFGDHGQAAVGWGGQFTRILVRPDGRIVVHDQYGWSVTQLNADGSPDPTFGVGGHVDWSSFPDFHFTSGVVNVALTPDGGLVFSANVYNYPGLDPVYGGSMVGRLLPDGTVDRSFGQGGRIITDRSGFAPHHNLRVLADGAILLDNDGVLRRLRPDGSPDPTFTPFAVRGYDEALGDLVVEPDGRIVVMSEGDGGLVRLNLDGTLDETFHRGGGPDGPWDPQDPFRGWDLAKFPASESGWDINEFEWSRMARQADGKYLLASQVWESNAEGAELVVSRFNTDGTLDRTFGYDGSVELNYSGYGKTLMTLQAVAAEADGSILLSVGAADWGWWDRDRSTPQPHLRGLIRLTADGELTPATTSVGGFFEAAPPTRVIEPGDEGEDEDPGETTSPPDAQEGIDPDDVMTENDDGGDQPVGLPGGLADSPDATRDDIGAEEPAVFAAGGASPFDWTDPARDVWD